MNVVFPQIVMHRTSLGVLFGLATGAVVSFPPIEWSAPQNGNGDTVVTIVEGESRHVGPGDVVIVPAGTPHWFSAIDDPVTYMEIRYDPGASSEIAPLVANWETADWAPPTTRPGFPKGLRNADIATDPGDQRSDVSRAPRWSGRFSLRRELTTG